MLWRELLLFIFAIQFSFIPLQAVEFNKTANNTLDIKIKYPGLYPEDIKYNSKTNKFLVGSFRYGDVYEVDELGNAKKFLSDDRLISTIGLQVDEKRNRLYVGASDMGVSTRKSDKPGYYGALGIYDLKTGRPIKFINLGDLLPGSKHLINSIAIDKNDNIYVTDSFASAIYKVDANDNPSVFLKNEAFQGEGICLNGVTFNPNGYLIVVKKDDGKLFRIPLNDPKNFSTIKINKKFIGGDGLIMLDDKNMIVTANRLKDVITESAFILRSSDNWKSAEIIDQMKFGDIYLTNGTIKKKKIYLMHSMINELIQAPSEEARKKLVREAIIQEVASYQ